MNVRELRDQLCRRLNDAGTENAGQESLWFCSAVCKIAPTELFLQDRQITPEQMEQAESFVLRRTSGEPLQYILGTEYFGDLEFQVGPGVLIPRPETYFMVEYSCAVLPRGGSFFEIGTGSGAVALSVAHLRPDVSVCASELSPDAMQWAERNRMALNLPNTDFRSGSFLEPFPPDRMFDCIAANLPYIPRSEQPNLQKEVRCFEPPEALFAEDSGMADIKTALRILPSRLNPGGHGIFEAGSEQLDSLKAFASSLFEETAIADDLFQRPRFLIVGKARK